MFLKFLGFKKGYRGESKKKLRNDESTEYSGKKGRRNELKRPEQILKERRKKDKQKAMEKHRARVKSKRRNMAKQKKGR